MSNELVALKSMIGAQAPPVRYAVSAASMSYFADSLMDLRPRYHGDAPDAPPMFFGSALDLVGVPAGDSRTMFGLALPLPADWPVVATGDDYDLLRPVAPGMVLTCHECFADAYEKRGRSGRLLFVVVDKQFSLQDGETVLRRRIACAAREPGHAFAVTHTPAPDSFPHGMALPEFTVGPVAIRHLAMFATATAEYVDIHYDADYARSVGLPGAIIQGLYKTALIGQMLDHWVAKRGRVLRLSVQHRGIDLQGNTLTAGGHVTRRNETSDGVVSTCNVWVRNQTGTITTHGSANVGSSGQTSFALPTAGVAK